ncbi:MAG: riboflavin biosynthesis protein RibF [Opitutus sp.]
MSLPLQYEGSDQAVMGSRPLHLAIGIFDGVHLGHRAVIEAAVHSAHRTHGQAAVLTFDPHPSVILRPQQPTRMIMTKRSKARLLGGLGVEAIVTQPFTAEFAQISAEEFLPWLKSWLPHLAAIYVGENWRFGRGRTGDISFLVAEGKINGLAVYSVPRVNLNGEPISSSRIRAFIESGEVATANSMLGYVYFAQGVVTPGKQLGQTLGFPTLNISWAPDLRPRLGVYVVLVSGPKSSRPLRAVANYGMRPTVELTTEPRLEIHVLENCPFGAGDEIIAEWIHFLRPEKKFSGVVELREQIARDRIAAETFFGRD